MSGRALPRGAAGALALGLAFAACRPHVRTAEVESRAAAPLSALAPVLVETSAPVAPGWTGGAQRAAAARIEFVGQGEAPTLEAAEAQARRDLLASVSAFVAVDVQSELESLSGASAGEEVQALRSVLRTRSKSALREVAADAVYWEKRAPSALVAGDLRARFFAHAWVDRTELQRARAQQQLEREHGTGRRTVALLPLRAAQSAGEASVSPPWLLAAALGEELAGRLAADPALYLADPAMVRSLLPGDAEARPVPELVEQVQDALLSDLVVAGLLQRHAGRCKVTLIGYDARLGLSAVLAEGEAAESELSGLQARLGEALLARARPAAVQTAAAQAASPPGEAPPPAAPPPGQEALEARQRAWALLEQGKGDEALAAIGRALVLAPDDLRSVVKLGRILERLGRFARIPPSAVAGEAAARSALAPCSDEGRRAAGRARAALEERAAKLKRAAPAPGEGEAAPWWNQETLDLDLALDLLKLQLALPPEAALRAPPPRFVPETAAEAWLLALSLARARGDARGEAEAELAFADLAVRADRIDAAIPIYAALQQRGARSRDWHLASLAAYGAGVAERKRGNLAAALSALRFALVARSVLGDKPYLLEIFSELGGVASELGNADEAARFLDQALRLAAQLGNDYLRTVLANNLGVLDFRAGRLADAAGRFQLAADRLAELGDSEGRMSAGLNLATALGRRGDAAEAGPQLDEVARLAARSGQEGRLAQLHAHRGELLAGQGRAAESLEPLATALLLYRGLGRAVQEQRLQASFHAAELGVARAQPAARECLKTAFWKLGTPVFAAARGQRRVQTVADLAPGALQPQDLVAALDGAALSALSGWEPPAPAQGARRPPAKQAAPVKLERSPGRQRAARAIQAALEHQEQLRREPGKLEQQALAELRGGKPPQLLSATRSLQQCLREAFGGLEVRTALAAFNGTAQRLAGAVLEREAARTDQLAGGLAGQKQAALEQLHRALDRCAPRAPPPPAPPPVEVAPRPAPPPATAAPPPAVAKAPPAVAVPPRAPSPPRPEAAEVTKARPAPVEKPGGPEQLPALEYQKPAEYDRILGSATVDPDVLVLLQPDDLPSVEAGAAASARAMLTRIAVHLDRAGLPREAALARLDSAALAWALGDGKAAFVEMLEVRDALAALGDVQGLAVAYEWLGCFLEASGEVALAADDWALALRLYRLAGDEAGARRVLGRGA